MFFKSLYAFIAVSAAGFASVVAETHTVHFDNRCGFGTPFLVQGGNILSFGGDFPINAPFVDAIAFLQTGTCGFNGEGCTTVEITLFNPTGRPNSLSGSSVDISLVPPHAFSVTTGFEYFNGCDGAGANCTSAQCPTALFHPEDTDAQVACQANNVNIAVTFCG
ncbi:hypothetical protein D9619_002149 [Psilocybe cf. subviscida]|uniref:Glycopeptide n=1 Tax=Psilocybe cf. subviscida TaxID=2480587 RepID=A0A8H5F3A1_9AGAR|nr:hypothetical protein D9619_002149 [Psilocybe cf. subviscida]